MSRPIPWPAPVTTAELPTSSSGAALPLLLIVETPSAKLLCRPSNRSEVASAYLGPRSILHALSVGNWHRSGILLPDMSSNQSQISDDAGPKQKGQRRLEGAKRAEILDVATERFG